jgi:hypothetical protein
VSNQIRLTMRRGHRQRRRRATPQVLDQSELAEYFGVDIEQLKTTMDAAGWRYHQDANGALWASVTSAKAPGTGKT